MPPRRRALLLIAAAFGASAAGPPTPPAPWTIDRAASRISFTLTIDGAPVQGVFKHWTADVAFDPAHPAAGRFLVSLDAASLVTGDPARDQAMTGAAALGAAKFPRIVFDSRAIAARAGGFAAAGELRVKGVAHPATAALVFAKDAGARRIDAEIALPPAAFAVPGRPVPTAASLSVRLTARDR